jgi:hypothetical protein
VFLLQDLDTQRVYRLHDFTKAQLIRIHHMNPTIQTGTGPG